MKQLSGAFSLPLITILIYMFLYLPIAVLIFFSFNDSYVPYTWSGFSLRWYYELFESADVLNALKNSLIVASSTVVLTLTMGSLLVYYGSRTMLSRMMLLFYANLAAPEIVLAVGLLSFFSFFSIPLGMTTLICAHTLIGLGYVVPILHARFSEIDYKYTEASLDLGATHMQTFTKIILPLLSPALIASALLVFVISLDDFIMSFFTAGATTQTLPLYIFSVIRSGASPMINALSTLLLAVSSLLVLLFSLVTIKRNMGVLE